MIHLLLAQDFLATFFTKMTLGVQDSSYHQKDPEDKSEISFTKKDQY